jgi:two-component system response regulator (stage 0 sporulation protein A)
MKTKEALIAIGIYPNLKGFKYIAEAVKIVRENSDALRQITKTLYPEIARRYDDKMGRVERAIRHAIFTAEQKNYQGNFPWHHLSFCHYTNGEFISLMAEYTEAEEE